MNSNPALRPDGPSNICGLSNEAIQRYARHLILGGFGADCQEGLCKASVLVIGAGGLGSPALLYLAAAGIGRLGIMDGDTVDISNLQRQVIHTTADEGRPKAVVAKEACLAINPLVTVDCFEYRLDPSNANELFRDYDVIVDCSDNAPTRYLINDTAVTESKPLVSGSALRMEGQLTVYGYKDGPCYRCLFPIPPPAEATTSCDDGGVLGPVPGVIGVLQATEVIKILSGWGEPLSGTLMIYDAHSTRFRNIKLRARKKDCISCSVNRLDSLSSDYGFVCGPKAEVVVPSIDARTFSTVAEGYTLIDVRDPIQYSICSLPGAINVPMRDLDSRLDSLKSDVNPIFVMCRRGVLSKLATAKMVQHGIKATNVSGGLVQWKTSVDPEFPLY